MRKICLIVTFLHSAFGAFSACDFAAAEPNAFVYPIAVAVDTGDAKDFGGDTLFVVDLELPGVWQVTARDKQVFVRGSETFRRPLNRPRCVAIHPGGGVLVGDSATREVYHVTAKDAEPKPLSGGRIGVPMAIAVSPDARFVYVADAEKRAVVKLPIDGGPPQWVARVNGRGLSFLDDQTLAVLTPDDEAIRLIDVSQPAADGPQTIVDDPPNVTVLLDQRPLRFPGGMTRDDGGLVVSDTYAGTVHRVDDSGRLTKLIGDEALQGPTGIARGTGVIWVADPPADAVIAFDADGNVVQTYR